MCIRVRVRVCVVWCGVDVEGIEECGAVLTPIFCTEPCVLGICRAPAGIQPQTALPRTHHGVH